jgi:fructosamine-3-kinase
MDHALAEAVGAALGARVVGLAPVSGGDINHALCASLSDGTRVFVKTQARAPARFFACEAQGLRWLAAANALRIPAVLAVSEAPAFLALEWIEPGRPARDHDERLGRALAALHRAGAAGFGLEQDNFLATLPQHNAARASWPEFYAAQRLEPLAAIARKRGLFDRPLERSFEQLIARLPALCGPSEPVSRLHGDLWGGNAIVDAQGAPVLIDPAVYGGHREIDLAMMKLFGGFGARVFDAYDEAFPLADGHEARVALYQLYPLLAHVCLFGSSYVSGVKRALDQLLQ